MVCALHSLPAAGARAPTGHGVPPGRQDGGPEHAPGVLRARTIPGAAWRRAFNRWDWQERAEAWDQAERARLRALEAERRFDGREQRLSIISGLLGPVNAQLQDVLDQMDSEEAGVRFPTLRMLLKDLLAAHRAELGAPEVTSEDAGAPWASFSADELAKAQRELADWRRSLARGSPLGAATGATGSDPAAPGPVSREDAKSCISTGGSQRWVALRNVLADLYPDEASTRRIAAQAGLDLTHIAFSTVAVNNWHFVLVEAEHAGRLDRVSAVAKSEYRNSPDLQRALASSADDCAPDA